MRRTFFLVAIAIAAALCACAQILGIDNVNLRDAGNSGDGGISEGSAIDGSSSEDGGIAPCVTCTANDDEPCAIACGQLSPNGIALDEQNGLVYWTTFGETGGGAALDGGAVWKARIDLGTTPIAIERVVNKQPTSISFAHGAEVAAYSLQGTQTIRLTDGGVNASIAIIDTGSTGPTSVSITEDGTLAFFICGGPGGTLYRRQIDFATNTLFTSNLVNGLTLRGNVVGWTTQNGSVQTSTLSQGSPVSTIATTQASPGAVELNVDGSYVAWAVSPAAGSAQVIVASTTPPNTPTTVWSGKSASALRFESSRNRLYIADHDGGHVVSVDVGATPVTIASGQNHPSAIDVGSNWIVWTNAGSGNANGSIMRAKIQ